MGSIANLLKDKSLNPNPSLEFSWSRFDSGLKQYKEVGKITDEGFWDRVRDMVRFCRAAVAFHAENLDYASVGVIVNRYSKWIQESGYEPTLRGIDIFRSPKDDIPNLVKKIEQFTQDQSPQGITPNAPLAAHTDPEPARSQENGLGNTEEKPDRPIGKEVGEAIPVLSYSDNRANNPIQEGDKAVRRQENGWEDTTQGAEKPNWYIGRDIGYLSLRAALFGELDLEALRRQYGEPPIQMVNQEGGGEGEG